MGAVRVAEFSIDGVPVPQGSKKAFVAGKRAIVVDDNKTELQPWRSNVAAAARAAYEGDPIEGAVVVEVVFGFVRPKSVKREHPSVKPDVDKLLRALFDGITDSGLWRDDNQVVRVLASKTYTERPGVQVRIGEYRKGNQ